MQEAKDENGSIHTRVEGSLVLNMLREEGHGVCFQVLISGNELQFVGYTFICV
jgi:hypothetical protein